MINKILFKMAFRATKSITKLIFRLNNFIEDLLVKASFATGKRLEKSQETVKKNLTIEIYREVSNEQTIQ